MESRTAFDRLLLGADEPASEPLFPRENDEDRIVRQNREALQSWAGLGVPVKV